MTYTDPKTGLVHILYPEFDEEPSKKRHRKRRNRNNRKNRYDFGGYESKWYESIPLIWTFYAVFMVLFLSTTFLMPIIMKLPEITEGEKTIKVYSLNGELLAEKKGELEAIEKELEGTIRITIDGNKYEYHDCVVETTREGDAHEKK